MVLVYGKTYSIYMERGGTPDGNRGGTEMTGTLILGSKQFPMVGRDIEHIARAYDVTRVKTNGSQAEFFLRDRVDGMICSLVVNARSEACEYLVEVKRQQRT